MAKHHICCVGIDIPGEEFEFVSFHSGASLFDADLVLFKPKLDYDTQIGSSTHQGLPNLSDESSVENRNSLKHWRRELKEAFQSGKTIFIFLRKPSEVFAATGTQELSGTGRGQRVIRHVDIISSYEALPLSFESLAVARGTKVKLSSDGELLAAYWKALGTLSHYEVYYDHQKSTTLMYTKTGEKTVASLIKGKNGHLLLLPALDFEKDEFAIYDQERKSWVWSDDAVKSGRMLLSAIMEIHKHLKRTSLLSPAPAWVQEERFQLNVESKIQSKIQHIDKEIDKLTSQRQGLETELEDANLPKALLYEKGKVLELAVIDALRVIGFSASDYTDEESQFDIVFESKEGRFLGEAEGKDRTAINIDKLQQLERNIQEDFSKEHVDTYAKGVLFGNPHRLTDPRKRDTIFTKKALSAAKRSGFALVHTPDLFPVVQYLNERKKRLSVKKLENVL